MFMFLYLVQASTKEEKRPFPAPLCSMMVEMDSKVPPVHCTISRIKKWVTFLDNGKIFLISPFSDNQRNAQWSHQIWCVLVQFSWICFGIPLSFYCISRDFSPGCWRDIGGGWEGYLDSQSSSSWHWMLGRDIWARLFSTFPSYNLTSKIQPLSNNFFSKNIWKKMFKTSIFTPIQGGGWTEILKNDFC